MAPYVPEGHTVERAAREPDRSEAVEQRLQERRRGDRAARSLRGQRIEERAWARRIGERVALRDQRAAQTAQQRRATLEPEQRIGGPYLEQAGQRRRVHRGERGSIDPQRIVLPRGESTAHECTKARDGESLRARVAMSR